MTNNKLYYRVVFFCIILLNSSIISYAQNADNISQIINYDNSTLDNSILDNTTLDNISKDNSTVDNTSYSDNITFDNSSSYVDNASDFFSGDDFYELEDMEITEFNEFNEDFGKTELPRLYIENMPKGNGGVTDLLRAVPSVQFDEGYRSAENVGEISPAEVSISGGKPYDNLFLIDGISNSSMLDPASDNPYDATEVTGNAQKFTVDSWLIEDITVYDSNVPTKYDGFTGGVVDVDTKRPDNEFAGAISYRTTSTALTYFHLNDNEDADPIFEKHFYTASFNIPIVDNFAILASYRRADSLIPQEFLNTYRSEKRQSETFMLKSSYNIDGLNSLDATFSFSPSYSNHFIHNTMNSDFTVNSGGYYGQVSYKRETGLGGVLDASINYSYNENSRRAPNAFYAWTQTRSKPWGMYVSDNASSSEGGWGSIDKYEHLVNASIDNTHDDLEFLGTHKLSYGANYEFIYGREHRLEDAFLYSDVATPTILHCELADGCVDGEQYFTTRDVTPESDTSAIVNELSAYAEDRWSFYRFLLRLGVRVTYDDYMDNINFSPRTELNYDIFDNNITVLTLGYNRYYGTSLLSNKLREGRELDYTEKRWTTNNVVQDWELTASSLEVVYNFEDLRTPYTDEFVAGITQNVFIGDVTFKYIERIYEDVIATERYIDNDGNLNYRLNNNGSSRYKSAQAKWEHSWDNHYLLVNGSWSQSTSSNDNYDDSLDLEDLEEEVYFNGELISAYQLPADNFNRPLVFNIGYVGRFYERLFISTNVKITSGYLANVRLDDDVFVGLGDIDPETGERTEITIPAYETVEYKPNVTVDVAIEWRQPLFWDDHLTVTLEINNLFNTKNEIGTSSSISSYEIGTQLWLGATYEF